MLCSSLNRDPQRRPRRQPGEEREATWQPIDNTPLHPEYPCVHCIESGAAVAVIESVLGSMDIPEASMTNSTAPGVTHRWTQPRCLCRRDANARIWAGFHYRFSTHVGTERDDAARRTSISKCVPAYLARFRPGCATPQSVRQCRSDPRRSALTR